MARYKKRKSFIENLEKYIDNLLWIKDKNQQLVKFVLNLIQRSYLRNRSFTLTISKGQRDIILKARQHGFSTLKLAEYFHNTITNRATTTVIVGHDEKSMETFLSTIKTMYEYLPDELKPSIGYNSKNEITFPSIDSRIIIMTYRMDKARSQTVNNLLMTEVAFWKGKDIGDKVAGMMESVPIDGNICMESTPNGIGGYFYDLVQESKNGLSIFKMFTYPWHINRQYYLPRSQWKLLPKMVRPSKSDLKLDLMEIYLHKENKLSLDQIMWRRFKMASMGDLRVNEQSVKVSRRFAQEYECSFNQSGSPVFDVSYLIPSCHYSMPDEKMECIGGADTSEGVPDGDYSSFYLLDLVTGNTVYKMRGRWKPKYFAEKIHNVMMMYGGLIGVELNNTGYAVNQELLRLWIEEYDSKGKIPYLIFNEKKRYGWFTKENNRKILFVELEEALRTRLIRLAYEDKNGILELQSCQYSTKMKEEAPEGMHDDDVMALGIAWQMRKYYHLFKQTIDEEGSAGAIII